MPDALRVLLAFPDVYEIGMSYQGLQILEDVLNQKEDCLVDRVFAPWPDLESQLRLRALPLVSLDLWQPLSWFEVVGLSLQYELNYSNVLTILELGGVPLRAAQRRRDDPIVIGGGPCATHPEPMATFFDAFFIGDAEKGMIPLLSSIHEHRRNGCDRPTLLKALAGHSGVYVPSLYQRQYDSRSRRHIVIPPNDSTTPFPIRRQVVDPLPPLPSHTRVAAVQAVFDRCGLEIARGCPQGCRFCQAGFIYRPSRHRDPEEIIGTVAKALDASGYDEVSLAALSTADYPAINPLVPALMDAFEQRRIALSVSSLRAYGLPRELLQRISGVRRTGMTFAPEAGTQRLRDAINKQVSEQDLLAATRTMAELGWLRLKLYFMLGLPTETDEDVKAIADLTARVLATAQQASPIRRRFELAVSISSHVPKPHCPFQWAAMDPPEQIERKQRLLRQALPGRVEWRAHDRRLSWLEGILARGDERLADAIEAAWQAGARFDSWEEHHQQPLWKDAFAQCGVDTGAYLAAIDDLEARLPWDHIDSGVNRTFLAQHYQRAFEARTTPACPQPGAQGRNCNLCGLACHIPEAQPASPERLAAASQRQMRPMPATASPVRLRFRFAKQGRARYLSHLDLIRHIPRILRRAGLTLGYSTGHHPKPLHSFGPALPLGYESVAEVLEVQILGEVDVTDLVSRLNQVSFDGLKFLNCIRSAPEESRLTRRIQVAAYLLALPQSERRSAEARNDARLNALCKPSGHGVLLLEDSAAPAADIRGDIPEESDWVLLVCDLRAVQPLKPAQVLEELAPSLPARAIRVGLWQVSPDGRLVESLDGQTPLLPFAAAVPLERLQSAATVSHPQDEAPAERCL